MSLKYSIIRFSARPGTGESLNVGLVVIDPVENAARVELVPDRHRLRMLSGRGDLVDATFEFLSDWKQRVESAGTPEATLRVTDEWLLERSIVSNNLLEFSAPAPVLLPSLSAAVEALRHEFLPEATARRHAPVTRRRAISALRRAYSEEGLERGVDFVERPLISGRNHREVMDFAVTNGDAVQLAQSWNFQQQSLSALSEAIKAWAWTVQEIRERGGNGRLNGRRFAVPKDVEVVAVYVDPTNDPGAEALAEALHAFRQVEAKASPMNGAERVARRAVRALAHHQNA